ncbi:hypothetical protein [Lacticaseibacillus pantheris]|uniref:hypothetical protein n=1 Tax=Lacticaseibacillus pantheris TaxID=171523 RepID=UPI000AC14BB9|nr:hypothetical protein [Lacticaseibacillus pantheris]
MTTVFVSGASGKMGRKVVHMLQATDDLRVVGGLDRAASDAEDFPIFGDTADINVTADVWVDFTIPRRRVRTPSIPWPTGSIPLSGPAA